MIREYNNSIHFKDLPALEIHFSAVFALLPDPYIPLKIFILDFIFMGFFDDFTN